MNKKRLLLVFLSAVIIIGLFSMIRKDIAFRPINVTIIDELTKQPLEGVLVKVVNSISYSNNKYFLWIPIDSDKQEINYLEEFKTNEKGIVQIPEYVYKVKRRYSLESQCILINIEAIDVKKRGIARTYNGIYYLPYEKEDYYFYRPNNKYKAYLLNLLPYTIKEKRHQLDSTKLYITEITKGYNIPDANKKSPNSFYCEVEEFVIYLERFKGY